VRRGRGSHFYTTCTLPTVRYLLLMLCRAADNASDNGAVPLKQHCASGGVVQQSSGPSPRCTAQSGQRYSSERRLESPRMLTSFFLDF
jgi:hypothetical protein